ncbi:hypothetical protein [Actinacidiphila sp. bgisy144]|uniref:hypothetical protein n=1 Tax=Actinacidiphila sp. bgisy144 TaxID=3413791 RepID=UPI003EBDD60E
MPDHHEGTATIEWWANSSTCLARLGVYVTIRAAHEWTCEARFTPALSPEDQEGFDFLMELDPLFTLRFDEGGTLLVDVVAVPDDSGRLSLTAHEPANDRPAGSRRVAPPG